MFEIINKHWIVFYWTAWIDFIILVGLLFAKFYFKFSFWGYSWQVLGITIGIISITILYKFYIWRNNALVITSQRLISKDQYSIFSKRVRALLFEDIVDISYIQKGITPILCNYGSLIIRMSSGSKILLNTVPNPWKVVESINQIKQALRSQGQAHTGHEQTAEPEESVPKRGETVSV